jgi:hypothetical protein
MGVERLRHRLSRTVLTASAHNRLGPGHPRRQVNSLVVHQGDSGNWRQAEVIAKECIDIQLNLIHGIQRVGVARVLRHHIAEGRQPGRDHVVVIEPRMNEPVHSSPTIRQLRNDIKRRF